MNSPAVLAQSTPSPNFNPVGWSDLNLLNWNKWGFEIRIGILWVILGIAIVSFLWYGLPWINRKYFRGFRTKGVKLTFRGIEWDICPDYETQRIAHEAWVEIKSRKAGLPFDEQHDVVIEVYDSWYQLFSVLRGLAKSIPADRLHDCDESRKVVELLMTALNEGLRPHLTRWQAKFRRWYEAEANKDDTTEMPPQEIQKRYPQYGELIADLRNVNREFVELANSLEKLVRDAR